MPASPLLLATEIVAPLSPLFLLSAAEDALEARVDAYDRSLQSSPYASPRGSPKSRRASGAGWVGTGITIANCLVGAGALGMPFALRMAGWSGLLAILSATLVTCYTAKCLVWCFNTVNALRPAYDAPMTTYDELVQHCFGRAGAIAMKVITVVELFGGTVCMVVLHTVSWPSLLSLPPTLSWPPPFGEVDVRAVVAAAMCACALPTLLVNSRYLALFAACGLGATALLFAVTCAMPLLYAPPAEGAPCPRPDASIREGDVMGHDLFRADGVGVAVGLALFAFAGHATFPELHARMEPSERARFGGSCDLGFSLAAAFYCAFAGVGYYFYGACTADAFTLNLVSSSRGLGGLATLGVLLSTFTSISVLCMPVVRISREALDAARDVLARALAPQRRDGGMTARWRLFVKAPPPPLPPRDGGHASPVLGYKPPQAWPHHALLARGGGCGSPTVVACSSPTGSDAKAAKALAKANDHLGVETPSTFDALEAFVALEAATSKSHEPSKAAERDVSYVSVRSAGSAGSGGGGAPGVFLAWDGLQVCLKAGLLALAAFLAVSVPNFGYVVSLMGACTCMLMSFILPALCNLFVHWHVHTALLRALNVAVVGLGFAGMAIGLQGTLSRGA